MRIAIITGASSGLGREYLRQLLQQEKFDRVWALARRQDRLAELVKTYGEVVKPLPLDLTQPADLQGLAEQLRAEQPDVAVLVNAAGFGKMGPAVSLPVQVQEAMIDLNCRAAVAVTALTLPYMHRGGRILEIASSAGFSPIPGLDVYAATKAFLLNYSKALYYELKGQGIQVTAVCPYWVKDTEFIPIALQESGQTKRHFLLASKAESVVKKSLQDCNAGHWVSTPGLMCSLHRIIAWLIPNKLMLQLTDWWHKI